MLHHPGSRPLEPPHVANLVGGANTPSIHGRHQMTHPHAVIIIFLHSRAQRENSSLSPCFPMILLSFPQQIRTQADSPIKHPPDRHATSKKKQRKLSRNKNMQPQAQAPSKYIRARFNFSPTSSTVKRHTHTHIHTSLHSGIVTVVHGK